MNKQNYVDIFLFTLFSINLVYCVQPIGTLLVIPETFSVKGHVNIDSDNFIMVQSKQYNLSYSNTLIKDLIVVGIGNVEQLYSATFKINQECAFHTRNKANSSYKKIEKRVDTEYGSVDVYSDGSTYEILVKEDDIFPSVFRIKDYKYKTKKYPVVDFVIDTIESLEEQPIEFYINIIKDLPCFEMVRHHHPHIQTMYQCIFKDEL